MYLDPARTALISQDFQIALLRDGPLAPDSVEGRARLDAAVEGGARALAAARSADMRIYHVRVGFSPGHPEASPHVPLMQLIARNEALISNTPGAAFDPRVAPMAGERKIKKHGFSALVGTSVDRELRAGGIDTLVLSGVTTHLAVEATARDAADRGYRVIILEDACNSGSAERHEAALETLRQLCEISDTHDLAEALGSPM